MARIPPQIPDSLPELERAIGLLGNRSNGQELTPAMQDVLREQLGAYPAPGVAMAWKRVLKARRDKGRQKLSA